MRCRTRPQGLQDENGLRALLSKYGFSADLHLRDQYRDLFTEDAYIDIAGRQPSGMFEGRDAIVEGFFEGSHLRSMTRHCQHHTYSGPTVFQIEGDEDVSEGDSIVSVMSHRETRQVRTNHTIHAALHVTSANYNRWTIRRVDRKWKISGRMNWLLGTEEADEVFATTLATWND